MRGSSAGRTKRCWPALVAAAALLLTAPQAFASRTASQRPELLVSSSLQPITATQALAPAYAPQGFALRLDTDPHPATFALFPDLAPASERVEPEKLASGVASWELTPNLQRIQIFATDSRWCREFLGPIDSPNLYQAFGLDPHNNTDPWGTCNPLKPNCVAGWVKKGAGFVSSAASYLAGVFAGAFSEAEDVGAGAAELIRASSRDLTVPVRLFDQQVKMTIVDSISLVSSDPDVLLAEAAGRVEDTVTNPEKMGRFSLNLGVAVAAGLGGRELSLSAEATARFAAGGEGRGSFGFLAPRSEARSTLAGPTSLGRHGDFNGPWRSLPDPDISWTSYLRNGRGTEPPAYMFSSRPHAHHGVPKRGRPGPQRRLAEEAQDILRRRGGIDPIWDLRNIDWAPNKGHTTQAVEGMVDRLRALDAADGTPADFERLVRDFLDEAAKR